MALSQCQVRAGRFNARHAQKTAGIPGRSLLRMSTVFFGTSGLPGAGSAARVPPAALRANRKERIANGNIVRYWAQGPDGAPAGWGAKLTMTFLFPK